MNIIEKIQKEINKGELLTVLTCMYSSDDFIICPFSSGKKDCYTVVMPGGAMTDVRIYDPETLHIISQLEKYDISFNLQYDDYVNRDTKMTWCYLIVEHRHLPKELFSKKK